MTAPIINVDLTHAQLEAYFKVLDAAGTGYHLTVADVGRALTFELMVDGSVPGVCIALRPDGTWAATAHLRVVS